MGKTDTVPGRTAWSGQSVGAVGEHGLKTFSPEINYLNTLSPTTAYWKP